MIRAMKTKFPALIIACFALLAWSAKAADAPVELKLKWPVGNRYDFSMTMNQTSQMQVPNQPGPVEQKMESTQEMTLTVVKEREGGGREIEMEFKSQKIEMKMGGNVMMKFDSKEKETTPNPATAAFSKMIGMKITYLTRTDGTMEKVEGLDQFAAGAPPQVQAMFKNMMTEDFFKQFSFSQYLPTKPVKQGDSWPVKLSIALGPLGTFTVDSMTTLSGWEQHDGKKCAVLDSTATLSSKPGDKKMPGGIEVTIEGGKQSGKTWFDTELGFTRGSEIHQDMVIKLKMPNPQGADKPAIDMSMNAKQEITMKVAVVQAAAK